jgi:ABC-type phosphate transport system ATPase subunit
MSIYENVIFGLRHFVDYSKKQFLEAVEENLKAVSLWFKGSEESAGGADPYAVDRIAAASVHCARPNL